MVTLHYLSKQTDKGKMSYAKMSAATSMGYPVWKVKIRQLV
jgi:hypothetical protein